MMTVPTSSPTKSGPCVGNVPAVTGIFFLAARLPAAAKRGIKNRKRPISIANPIVRLYHGVLALRPANALPLFPVPLAYAYRISLRPCGPLLFKFAMAGPGGFQYPFAGN